MSKQNLTPEQKAALERIQAKYRTPEKRAEHDVVQKKIQVEYPPKPTSNPAISKK
jgi:hypothetical protein